METREPSLKFLILSLVLVFSLFVPTAFAQYYEAVLVLDPIPSQVFVGDTLTFSGQLFTTDDYVIQDAIILIKDDVDFGIDTVLGTLTTDENGEFVGEWEAELRLDGGAYDFYAYYDGASDVSYARSQTHSVTVFTASGSSYVPSSTSSSYEPTEITLNSIPKTASIGQIITFSGKLTSNGKGLANTIVYIKDEDFADLNDFLTSATTDSAGKFSANWKVKNVDSGDRQFSALILDLYGGLGEATQLNHLYNLAEANTVEIYAEFEGNNQYSKSNTCLIENVDGVLQSNCYNNILSIQDDSSFENLIMSVLLSEIGVDIEGTDSLESILTNQANSMDVGNFEDLLLEALQDELDLGNTDLSMKQMLELLDDPSLASQYQSQSSPSPPPPSFEPPIIEPIGEITSWPPNQNLPSKTFDIKPIFTNGYITKYELDSEQDKLVLNANVIPSSNGYLQVTLPAELIETLSYGTNAFSVSVGGKNVGYKEISKNSFERVIKIPVSTKSSTTNIVISGNNSYENAVVVPEFQEIALMIFGVSGFLVVLLSRTRLLSNEKIVSRIQILH